MSETTVAEYFEQTVPEQFNAAIAASPEAAEQPELTATYEITGAGGGIYGLRLSGATIEVVPGGIEGSDLRTTVGIDAWRSALEIADRDPVVDFYGRCKAQAIKSLQGLLRLDLTNADGSPYESTMVFSNVEEPEVTLRMTTSDYIDMMTGRLNGQMAFMTGKLKFDGSLPLLMKLGSIS